MRDNRWDNGYDPLYDDGRESVFAPDTNRHKDKDRSMRYLAWFVLVIVIALNIAVPSLMDLASAPQDTPVILPPTTSPVSETQPTQPEVIDTGTAFSRIFPGTDTYGSQIDQFIEFERSMMQMDEVVMSFVGDCTLGTWPESSKKINYNSVYSASGSPTYSFDKVKSFFQNDDYTYINLETTLTTSTRKLTGKAYNFKGDPAWAKDMIAASFIEGCNLANNHSFDWSQSGYDETINVVQEAGMQVGDESLPITTTIGNVEVVLLSGNYIYPAGGSQRYGDDLTNYLVELIKQYKRENNIVIVNCHWGIELEPTPNSNQTGPARKFIDAGADMVIGHHPHTAQGIEEYNGKLIFYSLGNFAFGGKGTTSDLNRLSMIVRPRFALRDGKAIMTGCLVVPCYTTSAKNITVNNYQPIPLFGEDAALLQSKYLALSAKLTYGISELNCPTAEISIPEPTTTTTTTATTTTAPQQVQDSDENE